MPTPEEQRRRDMEEAAYERGVAAEKVTARMDEQARSIGYHEQRLNAINGSIDRTGDKLDRLAAKIDGVSARLDRRDAVAEALVEQTKQSGAQHLTRWQKIGVVVAGLIGSGTLVASVIQAIQGLH